jgi:hypothetical protein
MPNAEYYARNRAKILEQSRASYWRLKGKAVAEGRIYRKVDGRKAHLKAHYDMTLEEYEALVAEQNGVCFVCGGVNPKNPLHVDHNHQTDQVRCLLCTRCNTAVGVLEDPKLPAWLAYLEAHV